MVPFNAVRQVYSSHDPSLEPAKKSMKGFFPTPPELVDAMVDKLFAGKPPHSNDCLLDPGCGTGAFIEGVLRWCDSQGVACPRIVGVDSDLSLLTEASERLGSIDRVTLLHEDFLLARRGQFDFIIGNPPYVAITGLSVSERERYRKLFSTATGRFDLYLLFFEQGLRLLKPGGRLVFVTPEKFLYVETAEALRRQLAETGIEEIELISESSFTGLVTYPAVTTVGKRDPQATSRIVLRTGESRNIHLTGSGASWLPSMNGSSSEEPAHVLAEAFIRISCGVATGADGVYVVRDQDLHESLRPFAYPTLSGRSLLLDERITSSCQMLVPYSQNGVLLPEADLGPLGDYLREPDRHARLMKRTCVLRKPWYAFHENPPLSDILRPKILCKDIGSRPWFVADEEGGIVPRHSVYYLVPKDQSQIHELCAYLNSDTVVEFLMANCQRAANGFVRLQSHVLKRVPLPEHLAASVQLVAV